MGYERITISREELHEQVWAQPVSLLAKEYGLSDVGLTKICKRLKVPRPPRGYWAKKHRQPPTKLPATDGPTEHVIHKWVEPDLELAAAEIGERDRLIALEKQPENLILVPDLPEELHRLAERAHSRLLKAAERKKVTEQSWVTAGVRNLDIRVSPPLIDRAVRIMNALVVALEARGYRVKIADRATTVRVQGESFQLSMEESSTRIDHIPTEQEAREMKRYPWMTPPKYDYLPSGKLKFMIDKNAYNARRSWNDGKKRRIEDCLNAVIIGLIDAAYKEKSQRAENARREREWEEQERIRKEMQEAILREKRRLEAFESDAENWHRSQKLRGYIQAVRQQGNLPPNSASQDLEQWTEWATAQADRLDPLTESPPSILDEEHRYPIPHWMTL